ncbi:MAG TPA: hypothetical protein VFH72_00945 [Candidatus Baltobacteraceae bacterium]|nr:hypothetical protein [Candidatus Baltobacteraceae bacterium]
MKFKLPIVFIASLLAACGGGGSSPSPPRASAPSGNAPAIGGVTMTYAQSATATSTGAAPLAPGFTCTSPQTVRTASASGTISQTITGDATFNGSSGLTAVTSSVAMQGCADGSESYSETDYFSKQNAAIVLVGSTIDYTNYIGMPSSETVAYGKPGLIVAKLPLQAGQTWTTAASRSVTRSWSTNEGETLSVDADGAYSDALVMTNADFPHQSISTVENSDGSGSRTIVAGAEASAPSYGETLSAPSNGTVLVSPFGTPPIPPLAPTPTPCPTPGATPCPLSATPPYSANAWYPYDPSASQPLERIVSNDKGSVGLPSACAVSHTFPATAELVETVDATLDVWSGTSRTTTDAYIDPHDGLLCLVVSMQNASYVLGTTSADMTPVSKSTLTFTDSLQSENARPPMLAVPGLSRLATFWR